MFNDKNWKTITLITWVVIFCVATVVFYTSNTTFRDVQADGVLPSLTSKFDTEDTVELQKENREEKHNRTKDRQTYQGVGDTEGDKEQKLYQIREKVNIALARITELGNKEEAKGDGNNQRRTNEHLPNLDLKKFENVPDYVVNMAPDVFKKIPSHFLPEYKSPCWFNEQHELYCLPYFYIIGTAKCGTTDVWDKITHHPDVVSSFPKEPHWWARRRRGFTGVPCHGKEVHQIRKMTGKKDDSSIEWYLNWCKTFGVKTIENSPSNNTDGDVTYPKVFGDGSISTSFDIWDMWGNEERNYTNADLIHAVQPQAKIIMIVRDPTERYFSSFHFNAQTRGKSVAAFDKMARDATQCFTRCLQNHSERFCVFTKQCDILKGIYITFVEDWMRLYGHDGVYILRLEDWQQNTAEEYKKVLHFLDLPTLSDDEVIAITSRKAKNVNGRKAKSPPMWNTTRTVLQDFFRPYNKRLAVLMNDTRFEFGG